MRERGGHPHSLFKKNEGDRIYTEPKKQFFKILNPPYWTNRDEPMSREGHS
jgi:hypothetical protein